MLHNITLLILGLALLIFGAYLLVRGVSALARAAGVPPLVIGLTLVAFGTSLPEVVINNLSARQGHTELAFGNIVGSCTINIAFVLGVTALIRPLRVETSIIVREIPMMWLAVAALLVLSNDKLINRAASDVLVRSDGLILLLLFCVFLYYVIKDALTRRDEPRLQHDPLVEEISQNIETGTGLGATAGRTEPIGLSIAMTVGGLVGVAIGGRVTVASAVAIAHKLGISEVVIGLTLVSLGTTLPELATSIMAARRGQADIAIGNVVGSNIFNMLFIGGLVATICPIPVPDGGRMDLLYLAGLCAILLPVALRGPRMITRAEGGFLLAAYLTYALWRTYHG
jgi:cation:H+ antiporter